MTGFEDVSMWLNAFLDQHPPYWEGDDLATTYASAASVLLAACRLDTSSAVLIAGITGLPYSFVDFILQRSDRCRYRDTEAFRGLEQAIREREWDFLAIEDAREYAIDIFWEGTLSLADVTRLMEARGGRIFGGGFQDWVDLDELDNSMQHLQQEDLAME